MDPVRTYDCNVGRVARWTLFVLTGIGAAFVADAAGIPMHKLTADPATLPGHSHFRGAISNLGLLAWAVAAGALFMAAVSARRLRGPASSWVWFFRVTAVAVLYLGIDDALLLHEDVATRYVGVDERLVYVLYAGAFAVWLFKFRREIIRTDVVVLAVALLTTAVSVGLDALTHVEGEEEYFKYAGLACLVVWCIRTSVDELVRRGTTMEPAVEWTSEITSRWATEPPTSRPPAPAALKVPASPSSR